MNPMIRLKTTPLLLITLTLLCFTLLPRAQAVVPAPDGGYPGQNTAEGQSALLHLAGGAYNTALGWSSLGFNVTGSHAYTARQTYHYSVVVQDRVGRDGRVFRFPKVRTLPPDTASSTDKYALAEVQIPAFARFLRRSHLDELPHHWSGGKASCLYELGKDHEDLANGEKFLRSLAQAVRRDVSECPLDGLGAVTTVELSELIKLPY